jgi:hypothetical protein
MTNINYGSKKGMWDGGGSRGRVGKRKINDSNLTIPIERKEMSKGSDRKSEDTKENGERGKKFLRSK